MVQEAHSTNTRINAMISMGVVVYFCIVTW